MNELSIQEKAKVYDKVVAIVVDYYQKTKYSSFSNASNDMEVLERAFPELKESEDEGMKNFISNELVRLRFIDEKGTVRYNELTDAIAWLENKGEQKHVSNTLKEAFDKSKKDYSLEEKQEASDYSESIIPTSVAYGESEEEYMLHKIIEAAFIAGQNIKLKSIWSEEDEKIYNRIYDLIHNAAASNYDIDEDGNELGEYAKIVSWFKAFKYRLQSQPVKLKGFVAVDNCGDKTIHNPTGRRVVFFPKKPVRDLLTNNHYWVAHISPYDIIHLGYDYFPELKWEDEPIEVEITINKN